MQQRGFTQSEFPNPMREVKTTHLVVVPRDCPLASTRIYPSDEILHVSRDEHGGIGNGLCANSYMSLFDRPHGLCHRQSDRRRHHDHHDHRDNDQRTSDTVSDIFNLATTTAKRRRATDETVTLFSISDGLEPTSTPPRQSGWCKGERAKTEWMTDVPSIPMSYSLLSISASFCCLNGS